MIYIFFFYKNCSVPFFCVHSIPFIVLCLFSRLFLNCLETTNNIFIMLFYSGVECGQILSNCNSVRGS